MTDKLSRPATGASIAVQARRHEAFVSTLAHELRQPLSSLTYAIEILRVAPESAAAARAVEIIARQAGHMSRLVEDLIDAAHWARGSVSLHTKPLEVRRAVAEAVQDALAAAARHGHELVLTTGLEPLWVQADAGRLRQVLSNLIDNAIKYTGRGGRVQVTATRVAQTVVVQVIDTGRGFEPGQLAGVFDLFSQIRSTDSVGLGVGLSVARDIVTLHNGRIEARSQGLGLGAQFIVTLPAMNDMVTRERPGCDQGISQAAAVTTAIPMIQASHSMRC